VASPLGTDDEAGICSEWIGIVLLRSAPCPTIYFFWHKMLAHQILTELLSLRSSHCGEPQSPLSAVAAPFFVAGLQDEAVCSPVRLPSPQYPERGIRIAQNVRKRDKTAAMLSGPAALPL